jgi:molybdate/tungstate transport system substrate-binding protein
MRTKRVALVIGAVLVAISIAACGSSSDSTATGGGGKKSGEPTAGGETVNVLYAGSLVAMMENDFGPAFEKATGDSFQGYGAGSTELAQQIKGKVRQGDVFISASAAADEELEGAENGEWLSWYTNFAEAPLVLGYNPHSEFADALKSKPWYEAISEPGIRVGRTDPKLDPKGEKTVAAIEEAATKLGKPELASTLEGFPVYPEETLVGRLQSGQLDAGFFYENEAVEAGIPVIPIKPAEQVADYTVSILKDAPSQGGAEAFVHYLLGPGTAILKRYGLTVLKPRFSGKAAAVPAGIRSVVGAP